MRHVCGLLVHERHVAEDLARGGQDGIVCEQLLQRRLLHGVLPGGLRGVVLGQAERLRLSGVLFRERILDSGEFLHAAEGVFGLVLHDAHQVVVEVSVLVRHVAVAGQAFQKRQERFLDYVVGLDRGVVRLQVGAHDPCVLVVELRPADARRVAGEVLEERYGSRWNIGHGA